MMIKITVIEPNEREKIIDRLGRNTWWYHGKLEVGHVKDTDTGLIHECYIINFEDIEIELQGVMVKQYALQNNLTPEKAEERLRGMSTAIIKAHLEVSYE